MGTITKQQIPVLVARFVEFQEEFELCNLSTEGGQWAIQNTKDAIKLFVEAAENRKLSYPKPRGILHLISGDSTLIIEALDGSRLICQSKKTFKSFIDVHFVNWGINKPGVATPRTPVQVREIVGDGTFIDIFRALPGTWNQKWISQAQVIYFCSFLSGWLQNKQATRFLIKKDENKPIDEANPGDNSVVVSVVVNSGGLHVDVNCLEYNFVWAGVSRRRVVSPQRLPSIA